MSAVLGLNAKIYRNTGTYASPTWTEWGFVQDSTLDLSTSEADATTRDNDGWKAVISVLKEASLDVKAVHDTANAAYVALVEAWYSGDAIELAIVDGPIATVGTRGLRASFVCLGMSKEDPVDNVQMSSFSLKPTYSANAPAEMVIAP